jgi:hypothetical protein
MQLTPLGLPVASLILALLLTGCSDGKQKDQNPVLTGPIRISAGPCNYKLDTDPANYVKYNNQDGGIKLAPNQPACDLKFSKRIYIVVKDRDNEPNDAKRVRAFLPPQEIPMDGSCRWCYTNSAGGLSCVRYKPPPGTTCPFGVTDSDDETDKPSVR